MEGEEQYEFWTLTFDLLLEVFEFVAKQSGKSHFLFCMSFFTLGFLFFMMLFANEHSPFDIHTQKRDK